MLKVTRVNPAGVKTILQWFDYLKCRWKSHIFCNRCCISFLVETQNQLILIFYNFSDFSELLFHSPSVLHLCHDEHVGYSWLEYHVGCAGCLGGRIIAIFSSHHSQDFLNSFLCIQLYRQVTLHLYFLQYLTRLPTITHIYSYNHIHCHHFFFTQLVKMALMVIARYNFLFTQPM